ncbi:DUF1905 domain-containing protein [Aquihabitans sp. McL0605]|uniref:DUF1905 domain-containing protein n=1 Tax=Aquihabitans sp. McL0605 TaxID=3415671 RepID=UPI003CE714D3
MPRDGYSFSAEVWLSTGNSTTWHFLSVPEDVADDIDERYGHLAKGFGSQKVEVTIGATTWQTSVFPDTKRGTCILPVKAAVRKAEDLSDGSVAEVRLLVITE